MLIEHERMFGWFEWLDLDKLNQINDEMKNINETMWSAVCIGLDDLT